MKATVSLPAGSIDPIAVWADLHPHPRHGFLLGSGVEHAGRNVVYMSVGEPVRVFSKIPSVPVAADDDLPRFVGYLGFDAGRSFDAGLRRLPRYPNPLGTPPFFFADYPAVLKIDRVANMATLVWRGAKGAAYDRLFARVTRVLRTQPVTRRWLPRTHPRRSLRYPEPVAGDQAHFFQMVRSAKKAIAAGDVYQTNLSLRFERDFAADPCALYHYLCSSNPSPYAALLKCGDHWLVSNSPELLVCVEGQRVVTRPIAGTRPRARTSQVNARRRGQLLLSPKERAEHIMLVDLERNDLGRVCKPGSVRVTERFAVEQYSHVMHIVSQVEGWLASGQTSVHAVKALFPGGTITGCPKIRAVEWIEKLESVSRGPFYGSAGFFCGNGDAVFNILIRTALVKGKKAWVQAGAGIVADSHPGREYREVRAKAAALLEALNSSRFFKSKLAG